MESNSQLLIPAIILIFFLLATCQSTASFVVPSSASNTMSGESNGKNCADKVDGDSEEPPLLQLPSSTPDENNIPKLAFGETMKLDHLGPIIINTDGTTRRIDNWDALTDREREVTWRRIQKRNAERREILLKNSATSETITSVTQKEVI